MDIPGLNPLNNRPIIPGQGGQTGTPDLILEGPKNRVPAEAQTQAQTTAPFQAPETAQIQHSTQSITTALMEMNIPPTSQNQQMAQLLANYGHAVNSHTMAVFQQAMAGLSDKSSASMEAVAILLTQDLPVNDKTVAAMKQFLNGQPLPQQLQNLPKDLGGLLQQMQQTAQTQASTQAQPTPAQNIQQAAIQNQAAQALNPGSNQAVTQQIAQNIQSGQAAIQTAVGSAVVQQAAGQSQATENRADQSSKVSEQTTAQKMESQVKLPGVENKVVQQVSDSQGSQSQLVNQHLPNARPADQEAMQQLYLYLQGQEPEFLDRLQKGQQGLPQSPEAAVLKMMQLLQDISQMAAHLGENMQLKDYSQLSLQHQQIIQITGLLETRLREFNLTISQAFPELADDIQRLLQQDGMDMFSKLAQLLDENQSRIQEQLKLPGQADEKAQILNTLRQLMEQVGFQVEKIQSHLVAREMLSQNMPIHVIPLMVHANGESYPAEVFVQQNYDPRDPESRPSDERPLKVTLTLETQNLGRVSVNLSALKDDMNLDLKVLTRRVKLLVDPRLDQLKHKVESNGNYKVEQLSCRVVPDLESRQSMLLPPKYPARSLRRIEGIV